MHAEQTGTALHDMTTLATKPCYIAPKHEKPSAETDREGRERWTVPLEL